MRRVSRDGVARVGARGQSGRRCEVGRVAGVVVRIEGRMKRMGGCLGIGNWQRSRGRRGGVVKESDGTWRQGKSSGRHGCATSGGGGRDGWRRNARLGWGRERVGWRLRSPRG